MRMRGMAVCGLGLAVAVCLGAAAAPTMKYTFKLMSSSGGDAGKVTFSGKPGGPVKMHVELKNLPFGDHAVHIHQKAVCDAPDFKGAGGHFNPDMKQHGWDNPMGHHNGDLPKNVSVGEDHAADATFELKDISLDPAAPNSIFANGGTSVVVHEKADDMKTDPTGNAGNRIACAVVKQ
jgi:superoxide dismutase, Cu-Zn family